jgi:hypothetical protein
MPMTASIRKSRKKTISMPLQPLNSLLRYYQFATLTVTGAVA